MLRLAHPAPAGNATDPPARRKRGPAPSLTLTHDEARRVGAAIKATARAYGGHDVLATVIGVPVHTLQHPRDPPRSGCRGERRGDPLRQAHRGGALSRVRCPRRWRAALLCRRRCVVTAAEEDPEALRRVGEALRRVGELRALDDAWRAIVNTRPDDDGGARSFLALLLAAVTGNAYEGAEGDPPAVAVLGTVRATVEGWAHQRSGSTLFASVPYVELELLGRRLDLTIAVVRRSPGGVR